MATKNYKSQKTVQSQKLQLDIVYGYCYITYDKKRAYFSTIIDLYNRHIVAYHIFKTVI